MQSEQIDISHSRFKPQVGIDVLAEMNVVLPVLFSEFSLFFFHYQQVIVLWLFMVPMIFLNQLLPQKLMLLLKIMTLVVSPSRYSSTHCVWVSCERGLILITSCLKFAFKAAESLSHSEDLDCLGFECLCLLEPFRNQVILLQQMVSELALEDDNEIVIFSPNGAVLRTTLSFFFFGRGVSVTSS